jgi:hypothetical protein
MVQSLPVRLRALPCVCAALLVLQTHAGSASPGPVPLAASADMAITAIVASPSATVPDTGYRIVR